MAMNDQMMPTKQAPMGRGDPDAMREGMEPNDSAQEEEAEAQRKRVETLLSMRLKDAIDARSSSGIEEIWLEDQDQYLQKGQSV